MSNKNYASQKKFYLIFIFLRFIRCDVSLRKLSLRNFLQLKANEQTSIVMHIRLIDINPSSPLWGSLLLLLEFLAHLVFVFIP